MGVLSCSREQCTRIMCDTYVLGVGYVCWECKDEFKEYLKAKGKYNISEGEMMRELKKFIDIPKDSFTEGEQIDVDSFFEQYTKD